MTNDERMHLESSLIATIRKKLRDFAKACSDDTELVLLHQDAFAACYPRGGVHAPRNGDKLRFVTDQRAWNVDNPETLKGLEGHYVHAKVHVYQTRIQSTSTEVKMPTASETKKNDTK